MIYSKHVTLHMGIVAWKDRILELNSYLPYTPWKAGNVVNLKPRSFDEEELREILCNSITHEQRLHLGNSNHDISMCPFFETIALLRNSEELI